MLPISGPHGSSCFEFTHESGSTAVISPYGGNLISWKTADGIERLFLSENSEHAEGKAIRGGIPVIFPQFSDHGPFARHGFARRSTWEADEDAGVLHLSSTASTLAEWPHEFDLTLRPRLQDSSLTVELTVSNPGGEPFAFQAALHTYLRLKTAKTTGIDGLSGLPFQNQETREIETDSFPHITLPGSLIDRAYFGAGDQPVHLLNELGNLTSTSEGFEDTVVWNPGADHGIGDLPEMGWAFFACIEAAQIQHTVHLESGESWTGSQTLALA